MFDILLFKQENWWVLFEILGVPIVYMPQDFKLIIEGCNDEFSVTVQLQDGTEIEDHGDYDCNPIVISMSDVHRLYKYSV